MSWFLVAIMALTFEGGEQDIYVWTNPQFTDVEQCLQYVQENPVTVQTHLKWTFPTNTLERLLCVPENNLKKFLQEQTTQKKGENI